MTKDIKQMIEVYDIEFKEIDYDEISKFLGKDMTIEEILEEKVEDLLYIEENKLNEIVNQKL